MTEQKTIVITGAGRGLGSALTDVALGREWNVVATARSPHVVADMRRTFGDRAVVKLLDVTDPVAADDVIASAVRHFGGIDVIVNNAGFANISSIEDTTLDDFRAQVETNLWGAVHLTKAALPLLREQRRGHVIQVSSVSGRLAPAAGLGAYVSAKFALPGFSEALALEVAQFGIHVTVVQPGAMATSLASAMSIPPPSPHYRDVLAPLIANYGSPDADSNGSSPIRVAEAICDVAELDDPPLRQPLSQSAMNVIAESDRSRSAEMNAWADMSASVGP